MIRKSDVNDWRKDPVTQRLINLLEEVKQLKHKEFQRESNSVEQTALNTARVQGFIDAMERVLIATQEDLHDEEDEDVQADISEDKTSHRNR